MNPRSRHWQDLSWTDFADLPEGVVAILPVAAIEQHGPHLPLSTDATLNAAILWRALDRVAPDLPVLALPMQSVGLSVEHTAFPGTLTGSAETLLGFWTEIGRSVARAGVRRLVLFNSHGGQPQIVELACRRLRIEARMFAVGVSWFALAPPDLPDPHGIHGGRVETSMMLACAPELVDMARARNFRSAWTRHENAAALLSPEGAVGFGWQTQDLHPAGALGDASLATAEDGHRLLDRAADRLAQLLGEVSRFDVDAWMKDAADAGE